MKENQFIPWPEHELAQLRELAGKYPSTELSKMIVGRSAMGIQKMIRKQGLPRFVQYPPDRPRAERKKRVRKPRPVKVAVERPKHVEKPVAAPVRVKTYVEPRAGLRQAAKKVSSVSYPPLEYCMNCHSPVSSWVDHESRMSHMGCKRPAA